MERIQAVLRRATTLVERLAGPRTTQRLLLASVRGTPFWPEGRLIGARLCAKNNWFSTSIAIGCLGLKRRPMWPELRLVVADSCLADGQPALALEHAQTLIGADPDGFDGYHIASESLLLLGRGPESIALLEQGLQRCAESKQGGRSRHVQRHLKAYARRSWCPLYDLWTQSVLVEACPAVEPAKPLGAPLRWRPQAIQYWSQGRPPADVAAYTERWNGVLDSLGLDPVDVFDRSAARSWMASHCNEFLVSFDSAPHYAAESDVFRLAYASVADCLWLDSDLLPAESAAAVLEQALDEESSLLFLKRKVPYLQSSVFMARRGCPFFAAMARSLQGFDYASPEFAGVSRLHLIHDLSFGPARYADTLVQLCEQHQPVRACHDQLPWLQQMRFPQFSLSFFSGPLLVAGGGHRLAYKATASHWKVWARQQEGA